MTTQVIVSEAAEGSLELVQQLADLGEINHLGDGVYNVEASHKKVTEVTDNFPEVVLKVEYFASPETHRKIDRMVAELYGDV